MFEIEGEQLKIIDGFTDQGDEAFEKEDFDGYIRFYKKAWGAIPEPKEEWELANAVMGGIAEGYYLKGDYDIALEYFKKALTCYRGDVDSFINFRIGQIHYDKGDLGNSMSFLQKAWDLSEGRAFEDEDPKYLNFLKK